MKNHTKIRLLCFIPRCNANLLRVSGDSYVQNVASLKLLLTKVSG